MKRGEKQIANCSVGKLRSDLNRIGGSFDGLSETLKHSNPAE